MNIFHTIFIDSCYDKKSADIRYINLRPGNGCIIVGWGAAAGGSCGLGLLTLVLLLANSSLMVCGMSGSNLTPCCGMEMDMKITPSQICNYGGTNRLCHDYSLVSQCFLKMISSFLFILFTIFQSKNFDRGTFSEFLLILIPMIVESVENRYISKVINLWQKSLKVNWDTYFLMIDS